LSYGTFFCSHKYQKIEHYIIFEVVKKKIWANLQRILELFTQKFVVKLPKIQFWDTGYGKNLSRTRVKKAPDPGSGSATLVPRIDFPWKFVFDCYKKKANLYT
jgi:hypothetical protein